MKRVDRRHFIAGMLVAACCAGMGSATAETGVTDKEILIGHLGVLTGPLASTGKFVFDGVDVVYDRVNREGGINGRQIRYVSEDNRCQAAYGAAAAKKLIYDHKVFMIHGGACSNASLAEKPEIVRASIPWVITASTADSLTDPVNPMIFTTSLAAWVEGAAQLQRAIDLGAKRIAVVLQQDAWGRERTTALLAQFKKRNIEPIVQEELPPEPSDATAAALRIKAARPDAVILELFPKAAAVYMRDAFKVGLTPPSFGGSALGDVDAFAKNVGIPGAVRNLQSLSMVGYSPDDPKMAQWKKAIETKYTGTNFSIWHMMGIASGEFVVAALKAAGPNLTRESIAAALAKQSLSPETYAGPITCTPTDHQCYKSVSWFGLDDAGKLVMLGHTTVTR
jgi:branched-chain amino acid transport system substrate-binding protein